MYPQRPALLAPTFVGAFVGADDRLPEWRHAFKDPRAAQATELMVRLLRERVVPPSTLSLLGLVRHMTDVERGWFRRRIAG